MREKLDDPKYASWFVKFKGFQNQPYPGGQGKTQNNSFHVPACDFYNNGTAPRCSGFYHDQEQTPEHPGGGKQYPVDGDCIEQCDCGSVNPCGEVCAGLLAVLTHSIHAPIRARSLAEHTVVCMLWWQYIFDHRGGEVEGRNFRQWFINEYMITNETL